MAKKKKNRGSQPSQKSKHTQNRPASQKIYEETRQAVEHIKHREYEQARKILEAVDKKRPDQPDVLNNLALVYLYMQDRTSHQQVCERLMKLLPHDPDVLLQTTAAYLSNTHPAMALQTMHTFLETNAHHEKADELRQRITKLEETMEYFYEQAGVYGDEGFELALLHEQVHSLVEQGNMVDARKHADQLLHRWPNFTPALNNVSLSYFLEGDLDKAIEYTNRTLEIEPQNVHALANIARYLFLNGQFDEAETWATRLETLETDHTDLNLKKAETFSYMGQDERVLDAFYHAQHTSDFEALVPANAAMLYHLAAVAAMRLEREDEAQGYWKKALSTQPGMAYVQENLDDLKKPVEEQHAPWAFHFTQWMPKNIIQTFMQHVHRIHQHERNSPNDEALQRAARQTLRKYPRIVHTIPMLLDRGDPPGRQFALHLALQANTPEMAETLRDFALSQRGPDDLRFRAARAAINTGSLEAGTIRLWSKGEWRDIIIMDIFIHSEPKSTFPHTRKVKQLLEQSLHFSYDHKLAEAEELLHEALEIEPDAPDVLNNLAGIYRAKGKADEAEQILRNIYEKYPDYFFVRCSLAQSYIERKELDEAKKLLAPLYNQKRMHTSEFTTFCKLNISLSLAEGKKEGARSWVDMWESALPDDPDISYWRAQTGDMKASLAHFLKSKLGKQ